MPRTPQSQPPMLRQRVSWEDVSDWLHPPQVEILHDSFARTPHACPTCGARGLWTADPEYLLVCTHCETIIYVDAEPQPATGFWATIVRQLQLAEAAEAAR